MYLQIHLGRKRRQIVQQPPRRDRMIAVYCDKDEYRHDWPQIGKVIKVSENEVTIHWFSAGENIQCAPLTKANAGGKQVPWIDELPKTCIITSPFNLTKKKRLPQKIVKRLANKFSDFFD